jgi:hypothetical protein
MHPHWWTRLLFRSTTFPGSSRSRESTFRPHLEPLECRRLLDSGLAVGSPVNIGRAPGNQGEGAVAIDPTNSQHRFAVCMPESGNALFAGVSSDGGSNWTTRLMADGGDGLPAACCDPQLAWDQFGNLFLTYLNANVTSTIVALSTDGGATFHTIYTSHGRNPDQPSIAVGPGPSVGTGSVWVDWNQNGPMVAVGAQVNGLGSISAFTAPETAPGVNGSFGDIAIGPAGQVLITYQDDNSPANIYANLDADGLGPGGFGSQILVARTNVGQFYPLPALAHNTVDAEANLAWDRSGGPNNGRVYLVYTDAAAPVSSDTNIFVVSSDDNGSHWSSPVRVNDDSGAASQFLPAISLDQTTGALGVSFYDCRNDPGSGPGDTDGKPNDDAEIFATVSFTGGLTFQPNVQVSSGPSNSADANNDSLDFGDFRKDAFQSGSFQVIWFDNSTSLPNNPNGGLHQLNMATATIAVLPAIAGTTRLDVTGNGFSSDDRPLGNVTVTLYRDTGTGIFNPAVDPVVGTQVTPSSGSGTGTYVFASLTTGKYFIQEQPPAGYVQTAPANPSYDTVVIPASGDTFFPGKDFDNFQQISINGTTRTDLVGNGLTAADPPQGNVVVTVYQDNGSGVFDPSADPVAGTQITPATGPGTGDYSFTGLGPGLFYVQETVPAGFVQTTPKSPTYYTIAAVSGANAYGKDFANFQPRSGYTPPTGNAAFVQALYGDFLKRVGDLNNPNDAGAWVNLLNRAALAPSAVANAIAHSAEALGLLVDAEYLKILGRVSDAGGRAGFVSFLENGGSLERVAAIMLSSPEYAAQAASNSAFVQSLYTRLLERSGSDAEVSSWVSALPALGRAGLASFFLGSFEFRGDVTQELYGFAPASPATLASLFPNLLHRMASVSASEVNGWASSSLDILGLAAGFAGGGEYFANG